MSITLMVEAAPDGPVVVKRAVADPSSVERLRREGERLQRARHPGVVSVLRSGPVADGWELVMAHGGRALTTWRGAGAERLAGVVAATASTLADLHELGITHGRVDASHVLVSDGDRPRLCGFGTGEEPATAEDDVARLGALLAELLDGDDDAEPIPERRWRRRPPWHGWQRRALLLLADQAGAEEPSRRPTARRFAAAIAEAVPTPAHHGSDPTEPPPADPIERLRPASVAPSPSKARRAAPVLLVVGGLLLALGGTDLLTGTRPRVRSPEPATPGLLEAEPLVGSVLTAQGRRYRVGQEGDYVLLGDWSCAGEATPALFRPSTSEVFVFDRWAGGEELVVEPVATVPGGEAMVSAAGSDRCPSLSVRTDDGGLVTVSLEDVR